MSYILSIDVGTTWLKVVLFNESMIEIQCCRKRTNIISQKPSQYELSPDSLWISLTQCMQEVLMKAEINLEQIEMIAISTLKNCVILWNKVTNETLCNFFVWTDKQCSSYIKQIESSFRWRLIKFIAYIASFLNPSNARLKTLCKYRLKCEFACLKLRWLMNVLEIAETESICYGGVDSWLLWKLTNNTVHATAETLAGSSGIYDIFKFRWSKILCWMLGIPMHILPEVKKAGVFGHTKILGPEIPIGSLVGDIQASLISQNCSKPGDLLCTLGTGAFFSIITGKIPSVSEHGLWPQLGVRIKYESISDLVDIEMKNKAEYETEVMYFYQAWYSNCGATIEWAKKYGLFSDYNEIEIVLQKNIVDNATIFNCDTLYDANDFTSAFIKLEHDANKEHMLTAVIEFIVFKLYEVIKLIQKDVPVNRILATGGVCRIPSLLQMLTNLIGRDIEVMGIEGSALGAALLAASGNAKFCLPQFRNTQTKTYAAETNVKIKERYRRWKNAVANHYTA